MPIENLQINKLRSLLIELNASKNIIDGILIGLSADVAKMIINEINKGLTDLREIIELAFADGEDIDGIEL